MIGMPKETLVCILTAGITSMARATLAQQATRTKRGR